MPVKMLRQIGKSRYNTSCLEGQDGHTARAALLSQGYPGSDLTLTSHIVLPYANNHIGIF